MNVAVFILFGLLCLGGALNLLLQRHPINSALSLIVVMSSLAVLYLLLGAEFLALAQIIVYSGAIMVLFVFVIMLLNAGEEERTHVAARPISPAFPAYWHCSLYSPRRSSHCASVLVDAARLFPCYDRRLEPRIVPQPSAAV